MKVGDRFEGFWLFNHPDHPVPTRPLSESRIRHCLQGAPTYRTPNSIARMREVTAGTGLRGQGWNDWEIERLCIIENIPELPNAEEEYLMYTWSAQARTALRVTFTALNILGYVPGLNVIAGAVRLVAVAAMVIYNSQYQADFSSLEWVDEKLAIKMREAQFGIYTAQVARAALESLLPFGRVINLVADIGCFSLK